MATIKLICEECGQKVPERYQRLDGKWVCFRCQDKAIVAMYPGWARREAIRAKKAEQARKNFSK